MIPYARATLLGIVLLAPLRIAAGAEPPKLDMLVVAPHPDDEAIGCTGIILQALAAKQHVGLVVITNGDAFQGVTAVVKKTKDELVADDYVKLAAARQQHTLGAMGRLGIAKSRLLFLGYPDGGLDKIYRLADKEVFQQPLTGKKETYGPVVADYHSLRHGRHAPYTKAALLADLEEIIKAEQPKEIYVTHEADDHADHRAAFWFVRDAARAAGFKGTFFTYLVHGKGPKEAPTRRVALSKELLNRKKVVIEEYQVGMSPFHDKLAETYAKPEELFWRIRIERTDKD